MDDPQTTVDPITTTNEEKVSQPIMKIQNTNLLLFPMIDPQSVQEPEIETTEETHVDSSHTHSSPKGIKKIRKPQFNKRGVSFRELTFSVSPASKKRQAMDMAQKL
ncbi:unnamed protein product [Lactuca virosa]|uniref:Uncharacterized protein n=1 Tax=Lactuca virosa TaxID=75947 RepID=A0AAU9P0C2_9ASTR|nr:unnamed protein product [Lactuca virosa]